MEITFKPQSAEFDSSAKEYQEIWRVDGKKIIGTLEKNFGKNFPDVKTEAIIFEGPSHSGNKESPMMLRASYDNETKKGTLVHELAHWLLLDSKITDSFELHLLIFPGLYKTWVEIYGEEFAKKQVAIESERKGTINYKRAWVKALGKNWEDAKE